MTIAGRRGTMLLLIGDISAFVASLWLAMALRALSVPTAAQFYTELKPFAVLFAAWVLVFYIAGLYSKSSLLMRTRMVGTIFNTQVTNIVLAALFFFFIPYFGITPKTVLAIYLIISLSLIFLWRLFLYPLISAPSSRERAALLGSGAEVDELVREINGNTRYPLTIELTRDPAGLAGEAFAQWTGRILGQGITLLIVDIEHKALKPVQPHLYDLVFAERRMRFVDFNQLYEEVFDRVPLALLNYEWFLSNLTAPPSGVYLAIKRAIDVFGAIAMGVVTLVAIPVIWIAMMVEDGGPLFIIQERIGMYGKRIRVYKFRSMRHNDASSSSWVGEEADQARQNRVTRVGSVLRVTSIDEFPQFLNILAGDISLVGPRNDIAGLGARLAAAIPYYMVRYAVKPGITGWAQINQRYEPGNISPQSIAETKMRLAYDFCYIKNRSLALDFMIALRTLKRMFFRISAL